MAADPLWMTNEAELRQRVRLAFGRLMRDYPESGLFMNEVGHAVSIAACDAILALLGREGVAERIISDVTRILSWGRYSYGEEGSPDLVGWLNRRWIGLELKRLGGVKGPEVVKRWDGTVERKPERRVPPGAVSAVQEQWHDAARRRGAFVAVVRDPAEVAEVLERARAGASE